MKTTVNEKLFGKVEDIKMVSTLVLCCNNGEKIKTWEDVCKDQVKNKKWEEYLNCLNKPQWNTMPQTSVHE